MSKYKPQPIITRNKKFNVRSEYKPKLIYCNGNTEKAYFQDLCRHYNLSNIDVVSSPSNRLSLVEELEEFFKKDSVVNQRTKNNLAKYVKHEKYVVFDVDALSNGKNEQNPNMIRNQVDAAVEKCKALSYIPIISNECFELWFLLHYCYLEAELHRDQIYYKLSIQIGQKYEKLKIPMFIILLDKIEDAIKNAKKLAKNYSSQTIVSGRRPYTNVYELVQKIIAQKQG